jgi:hypothetical protein
MEIERKENAKEGWNMEVYVYKTLDDTFGSLLVSLNEISRELNPLSHSIGFFNFLKFWKNPYLPAFHSPGWMLRYILGPHDSVMLESLIADVTAGITVGLTLIPQVDTISYT